jgi:hypothetical protein
VSAIHMLSIRGWVLNEKGGRNAVLGEHVQVVP